MSLQHVFRPLLIGVLALLLIAILPSPIRAVIAKSSTSVHYIYADDGQCPDTIDGYQLTGSKLVPTPGSPYSAGNTSCTQIMNLGSNTLAVTPANKMHGPCLVHSDGSQPQVESFSIDPATGVLALVSTVSALDGNHSSLSKDIRISNNGSLVYVSITPGSGSPGNLSSLALGAGCTLKLDQQLHLSTKSYSSILLISASRLVAIDFGRRNIDTYALTPSGGIALVNSVHSQFIAAEGVAAQTIATSPGQQATDLYTGQFRLSIKPAAMPRLVATRRVRAHSRH